MTIKLPKRGTMSDLVEALAAALVQDFPEHAEEICDWTKKEIQKKTGRIA